MIDNIINVVFSDLATQKIDELLPLAQEKIYSFFQVNTLSNLKSDKAVQKLSNDFFAFRVDKDTRVIFTFDDDKILITDIANYSKEGTLLLPDPKTIEYYQKIDPRAIEKILKLTENQMEHRIMIEREILKREYQYEKIGFVLTILFTFIGITFSAYLLLATEKTTISIITLLTTLLPTMLRLMTIHKK